MSTLDIEIDVELLRNVESHDAEDGPPHFGECPATKTGTCETQNHKHPYPGGCRTFYCSACAKWVPWCFGDCDGALCNDCSTTLPRAEVEAFNDGYWQAQKLARARRK